MQTKFWTRQEKARERVCVVKCLLKVHERAVSVVRIACRRPTGEVPRVLRVRARTLRAHGKNRREVAMNGKAEAKISTVARLDRARAVAHAEPGGVMLDEEGLDLVLEEPVVRLLQSLPPHVAILSFPNLRRMYEATTIAITTTASAAISNTATKMEIEWVMGKIVRVHHGVLAVSVGQGRIATFEKKSRNLKSSRGVKKLRTPTLLSGTENRTIVKTGMDRPKGRTWNLTPAPRTVFRWYKLHSPRQRPVRSVQVRVVGMYLRSLPL